MFEPGQYREKHGEEEPLISTTMGVRNRQSNTWSYYAQLRELDETGKLILRSMKKIA